MTCTLTAPGAKRLNPKHDEPPSNFAFKCNLRRYNEAREMMERVQVDPELSAIMSDSAMIPVLADVAEKSAAVAVHMENPGVASKLRKLADAGIITL